jgi:hypothetical protein
MTAPMSSQAYVKYIDGNHVDVASAGLDEVEWNSSTIQDAFGWFDTILSDMEDITFTKVILTTYYLESTQSEAPEYADQIAVHDTWIATLLCAADDDAVLSDVNADNPIESLLQASIDQENYELTVYPAARTFFHKGGNGYWDGDSVEPYMQAIKEYQTEINLTTACQRLWRLKTEADMDDNDYPDLFIGTWVKNFASTLTSVNVVHRLVFEYNRKVGQTGFPPIVRTRRNKKRRRGTR